MTAEEPVPSGYDVGNFAVRLAKHIETAADRYSIPIRRGNCVSYYGTLVATTLLRKTLELDDVAVLYVFLARNVYALGPAIAREFIKRACGGDPNFCENAHFKARNVYKRARDVLYDGVTAFDVIAGAPVVFTLEQFERNHDRICRRQSTPTST